MADPRFSGPLIDAERLRWSGLSLLTLVLLAFFALAYAIYVMSQAPILSGIQASVEPGQRGFAVAIALFFNNLVGQALGLALIGWVSDWLAESYGSLSLTVSVFGVCLVSGILAMAVFAWTAAQMGKTGYLEKMAQNPS